MKNSLRILLSLSAAVILAAATGCGGIAGTSTTLNPGQGATLQGVVHGGRQPISGANVYLYAAGTSGYGGPSLSRLTTPVTTDSSGGFSIGGAGAPDYTCPSPSSQMYIYAAGGNATGTSTNSSIGLLAALGTCSSLSTLNSFITVNEVSTVATAYAIAGYATDATDVSSSSSALAATGIANAFATAANLEQLSSGEVWSTGTTPAGNGTLPTSKINTLANILAACINSTGSGSTQCSTLFSHAKNGNTVPTDTATAAINIAHNPGANVSNIYGVLSGVGSPFQPTLSAAPTDFTISLSFTGGGMSFPTAVSVAASGNVWVANYNNIVSEFLPDGAAVFSSGIGGYGINESYGMALDAQGDVWIANQQTSSNSGSGNITELDASGQEKNMGLTGGGIDFPTAVAADPNGDMWFVDYGDSKVTLLNSSGSAVSAAPGWGGSSLVSPVALAVDSSHNAWVGSQGGLLPITKISGDGTQVTTFNCDCNGASGVAVDQNNNVWVANYYGNSISELSSSGTLELDAVTGGGVKRPQGIAVDGAGTVWVTNFQGDSFSGITGYASATPGTFLSPSAGFGTDAPLLEPYSLAIDGSGNIWISNSGNNTITEFVGIAAPVRTPLVGPPQLP